MAYNTFTLKEIKEKFQVSSTVVSSILGDNKEVELIQPSPLLKETLDYNIPFALAISTEKARSELIVMPILVELRKLYKDAISIFSGIEFMVDRELGLNGRCDFIIALDKQQFELNTPIITLVEAKNDNINNGIGQCIAEMIAAKIFNEKDNKPASCIYGVVTTGSIWKFIKLENNIVSIETREIHVNELPLLLGVLYQIIKNQQNYFALQEV